MIELVDLEPDRALLRAAYRALGNGKPDLALTMPSLAVAARLELETQQQRVDITATHSRNLAKLSSPDVLKHPGGEPESKEPAAGVLEQERS